MLEKLRKQVPEYFKTNFCPQHYWDYGILVTKGVADSIESMTDKFKIVKLLVKFIVDYGRTIK